MKPASLLRTLTLGALTMLCLTARAEELTVAFGINVQPYVMADARPPAGIELELFRAALAVRGHTMRPVFVTREAMAGLLRQQKADAAQRGAPGLRDGDGLYYAAEPTVPYRDVAVTLKKNNLELYSVADLRGKSVVTFPGAGQFLGAEYDSAVKASAQCVEVGDEPQKLGMLLDGSAQVYVGDVNVLEHLLALTPNAPEVVVHRIFLPSQLLINNAVFRDARLRDDFNAGIKAIKENGAYQQIVRRYLK